MGKKIIIEEEETVFKKFFSKGVSISGLILLNLKESGEMFLRSLPDCYPGFALMKKFFGIKSRYKMPNVDKKVFNVNLWRLEKQGLIQKLPEKNVFLLTEKGEKIMVSVEDRLSVIRKSWDGKIRIVAFDIPQNKNYLRGWIRKELIFAGFKLFQKSVYVGKYALPKSFYEILVRNDANQFICIFTAGVIDNKEEILKVLNEK